MMRPAPAFLLLLACAPAFAASERWHFRVLLDGRDIGHHRFTAQVDGDALVLRSEADFDVRLLKVPVYRYVHAAVEHWRDGCLESLDARTETNGRLATVSARIENGFLAVERSRGIERHGGCVMSFAYWDPRILQARRLLNSQTGELVPVEIKALGDERRILDGREVLARRYRLVGPSLEIDLWYADRRWIALEAATESGRRLRYEPT